jgi:transcriptional regulator with XRE-family HTH domain
MKINDFEAMGDYGIRFLLFRKAIKKTQEQLAEETETNLEILDGIEKGSIYPEINYLHFLNKKYGLNINWILCGDGEMFIKNLSQDLNFNYVLIQPLKSSESGDDIYNEFITLMQVPAVQKVILASWEVFKKQLRED